MNFSLLVKHGEVRTSREEVSVDRCAVPRPGFLPAEPVPTGGQYESGWPSLQKPANTRCTLKFLSVGITGLPHILQPFTWATVVTMFKN